MFEQIKKDLSRYITLTKNEEEIFLNKLVFKKFKKKEMILMEGEVCSNAFFINKGCLRYFFNIEGNESTGQFFFENAWYTDFESFIQGNPASENIQALEKTEVLLLSRTSMLELFEQIPKFEKFGRLIAENAFLGVKARNNSFLNQTPEERYRELIESRPKVVNRIAQIYIASYLGIKPESLSRIRKRWSDNSL